MLLLNALRRSRCTTSSPLASDRTQTGQVTSAFTVTASAAAATALATQKDSALSGAYESFARKRVARYRSRLRLNRRQPGSRGEPGPGEYEGSTVIRDQTCVGARTGDRA
jgi:hypothetical protein